LQWLQDLGVDENNKNIKLTKKRGQIIIEKG
jgi:hypothetical protein